MQGNAVAQACSMLHETLLHREERRVASHTSDEQRLNARQSGPQRPYTHTETALESTGCDWARGATSHVEILLEAERHDPYPIKDRIMKFMERPCRALHLPDLSTTSQFPVELPDTTQGQRNDSSADANQHDGIQMVANNGDIAEKITACDQTDHP